MDPISFSLGMLGALGVGKVCAILIEKMRKEDEQYYLDQRKLIDQEELIEAEKRMRAYYGYK